MGARPPDIQHTVSGQGSVHTVLFPRLTLKGLNPTPHHTPINMYPHQALEGWVWFFLAIKLIFEIVILLLNYLAMSNLNRDRSGFLTALVST